MLRLRQDDNLRKMAVKAMASVTESVAKKSVHGRCFLFMHKPEEPKNLEKRLEALKKGEI